MGQTGKMAAFGPSVSGIGLHANSLNRAAEKMDYQLGSFKRQKSTTFCLQETKV